MKREARLKHLRVKGCYLETGGPRSFALDEPEYRLDGSCSETSRDP